MRKVCFVVQRYGLEVNGGAELLCRQMVERMKGRYDIDVLTTKAKDYVTWKNEYENDIDSINGVTVRRFRSDVERLINKAYLDFNHRALVTERTVENGREWVRRQGPYCPALVAYIRDHADDYEVFVFFTYLYYTTVCGLPEVCDKAILFPTAHEEPPIHQPVFEGLFSQVKYYFFNTAEEEALVGKLFGPLAAQTNNGCGGAGVDLPEHVDGERFKEAYGLDEYLIYVGRIETGKLCNVLFDFYRSFKARNKRDIKLVLMGKSSLPIPKDPDIVNLGFVSDQDKFDGIAGAKALVNPSLHESLSIVVLEAMALRVPVLVNADCDVLEGHCLKSNAGLYYRNYFEFEACLNYILDHPETTRLMGDNGYRYVEENYRWDKIIDRLCDMVEMVAHRFDLRES